MTRVKVCGLTRDSDVRAAVRLGACACGFVLSESPRQVTPERACWLAGEAGGTLTVGVVTTEPPEWIAAALDYADLRAVQLSAGSDGPTVGEVRAAAAGRGLTLLIIAAADTPDAADADLVLLDARGPGAYGGTGVALDWEALARQGPPAHERFILAGGLTAANVGRAIAALHPQVVDVSSGVEAEPGVKDPALLAAFFAAVAGTHGHGAPTA